MTNFETLYKQLKNSVDLESTYLGWIRQPNPTREVSKSALLSFFKSNQKFHFSTGCSWEETLNVTDASLREVSPAVAIQTLQAIINEAVEYGSVTPISPGDAESLAHSFLSDFDNPFLFSNCEPDLRGGVHKVTSNTADWGVFAIDSKSVGFLMTVNGE